MHPCSWILPNGSSAWSWVSVNGSAKTKDFIVTIAKLAAVLLAVGAGLLTLAGVLSGLGMIAAGLAGGLSVLGTALGFLLSPVGLIAAALVGGIAAWLAWTDSGQEAVGGLPNLIWRALEHV